MKKHPDIEDAIEFIDMKVGSIAHNNVKNWKRRLRGTIITKVDGETVTSVQQMKKVTEKAKRKKLQEVNIEFGSLKAFAINGAGIPTLQADQLNVIAHHINAINMKNHKNAAIYKHDETKSAYVEFWNDPKEWPVTIDIKQLQISKLTQRKIFKEESQETIGMFVKLEWKQLD